MTIERFQGHQDILSSVFHYLDPNSLTRVGRVCRTWRSVNISRCEEYWEAACRKRLATTALQEGKTWRETFYIISNNRMEGFGDLKAVTFPGFRECKNREDSLREDELTIEADGVWRVATYKNRIERARLSDGHSIVYQLPGKSNWILKKFITSSHIIIEVKRPTAFDKEKLHIFDKGSGSHLTEISFEGSSTSCLDHYVAILESSVKNRGFINEHSEYTMKLYDIKSKSLLYEMKMVHREFFHDIKILAPHYLLLEQKTSHKAWLVNFKEKSMQQIEDNHSELQTAGGVCIFYRIDLQLRRIQPGQPDKLAYIEQPEGGSQVDHMRMNDKYLVLTFRLSGKRSQLQVWNIETMTCLLKREFSRITKIELYRKRLLIAEGWEHHTLHFAEDPKANFVSKSPAVLQVESAEHSDLIRALSGMLRSGN